MIDFLTLGNLEQSILMYMFSISNRVVRLNSDAVSGIGGNIIDSSGRTTLRRLNRERTCSLHHSRKPIARASVFEAKKSERTVANGMRIQGNGCADMLSKPDCEDGLKMPACVCVPLY